MSNPTRFIALAAITQPHGVHGRVKLKLFTQSPESFAEFLPHITLEDGTPLALRLCGEAGGAPVVEIAAIKNREMAQLWRGKLLGVARAHMPELESNEYYIEDLIGITLTTEDAAPYGTITAVENYGSGDVVLIHLPDGTQTLYPLTSAIFPDLNTEQGTGIICVPDIIIGDAES